jgi:5-enolpyruvylshikimate-3-phosphate synthase
MIRRASHEKIDAMIHARNNELFTPLEIHGPWVVAIVRIHLNVRNSQFVVALDTLLVLPHFVLRP